MTAPEQTGASRESAAPEAPGSGSATVAPDTTLSAEAHKAATEAIDALQRLSNHVFDAGEEALADALKVTNEAQTRVSDLLTQITEKISGKRIS